MFENLIPFRWNISSKSELGNLITSDYNLDNCHLEQTRECCSKILQYSDNGEIVFVGRSLDDSFDYLNGLFQNSSKSASIRHLNISLFGEKLEEMERKDPRNIDSLKAHFSKLNLDPLSIINSPSKINFVDVVYKGGTYGELFDFLCRWTEILKLDKPAMIRKLRFLGITQRKKNSPNTWRWYQQKDWVNQLSTDALKNISVEHWYWSQVGDNQEKLTKSNRPDNWFRNSLVKVNLSDENLGEEDKRKILEAVNRAYQLYGAANTKTEKEKFRKLLNNSYAKRQAWLNSFLLELK